MTDIKGLQLLQKLNRNTNYRKYNNGSNDNKRQQNWSDRRDQKYDRNERNDRIDRNYRNERNGMANRPTNAVNPIESSEQKPSARTETKQESNQSSQMPGFPVNRNQSSPPFVSNDPKLETNSDQSVDPSAGYGGQESDIIAKQMAEIDLKDISTEKSDITTTSTSELMLKTDQAFPNRRRIINTNNSGNNFVGNSGNNPMVRRNTVGSDFRPIRRFLNANNAINQTKFYGSGDRFIRNNKFEANDSNRRSYNKPKQFNTVSQMSQPVGDYMPNRNPMPQFYSIPTNYESNQFNAFGNCSNNCFVNPYYGQQLSYAVPPQPSAPNTIDTNIGLGVNGKSTEADNSVKNSDKTNSSNELKPFVSHFIPFEASMSCPFPPTYLGHIRTFTGENGMFVHYFVSVIPANIAPLALEVDSNGAPILPSNCSLIF